MKKGVIVVLVLLAVAVLVAPALVGRLAEKTMDDNLNWAAEESGELKVTSERFDRGWFSSAGRHRVELRDGQLLTALQTTGSASDADDFPVLIINTDIDHGIAQVATGSSKLVSRLQVELPDGEIVDLPGTIFSTVGLTGTLDSNYVLEAGSQSNDNATATWGDTNIKFSADPASGVVEFDGSVGSLEFGGDDGELALSGLRFDGMQEQTRYGVNTGDLSFSLSDLSVSSPGASTFAVRSLSVDGTTGLDGDAMNADVTMAMRSSAPRLGEMTFDMDFSIAGADAASIGRINQALKDADTSAQDPVVLYAAIEDDLKQLFASGFAMSFDRFDVALPQGAVEMKMQLDFAEDDDDEFDWSSLLLSTEALIDLSLPAALVETMGQDNQQLAMAIGGGFLVRQGDVYVMKARLKKGLATVNGAPIPIPAGGF